VRVLSHEVAALARGVPELDGTVMAEAFARLRRGGHRPGTFGRLEHLWVRLCGMQGRCPAAPFEQRRLVAFVADHPEHEGYAGDAAAAVLAGRSPTAELAERVGVGIRVVDIGLATDLPGAPADTSQKRVRRGAGAIGTLPAQTPEEADAAFAVGMAVADAEIDAGADLLLLTSLGTAAAAAATAVVCAATSSEPVHTVGRAGVDDATWMRRVAAVRDALRRTRSLDLDPMDLLTHFGGPDLAAMAGFVVGAALRRTPVVLDGLAPSAAAVVAAKMSPRVIPLLVVSHRGADKAHAAAIDELAVESLLDLGLASDEGEGALLAVPVIDAAVACLSDRS
jgi:nicotinate-nucleotide--dimethylbenzimidazole phosphoribosyltransferase